MTNLINVSSIVDGGAVDNSGAYNIGSYAGFSYVRCPVTAGNVYTFSGLTNTNSVRARFENSSNAYISGVNLAGAMPFIFTAPVGATFVVLNCKEPTQTAAIYSSLRLIIGALSFNDSFLQSSVFVAFGDSFIADVARRALWLDPICADLKLACTPIGGSGYAVTRGTGTNGTPVGCILDLLSQVYTAAPNIVLLEGGTNDCFYKMTIGSFTDLSTNQNTYYGAYKYMVEQIQANLPGVRIVILVPPKRAVSQSGAYEAQLPYTAVPLDVAERYSIPVLNLFHDAWTDTSLQAATNPTTTDGAHPSAFGGAILARLIIPFLKQFI